MSRPIGYLMRRHCPDLLELGRPLSSVKAAEYLGIGQCTLRQKREDGEIEAYFEGGMWLYTAASIARYREKISSLRSENNKQKTNKQK